METLTQLRNTVLHTAVPVGLAVCVLAFLRNENLAKGFLLGMATSSVFFMLKIRSARSLANNPWFGFFQGILGLGMRFIVYGAVLYRAYRVDPVHRIGFYGAVIGLLLIPVITMAIGYTGADLRKNTRETNE